MLRIGGCTEIADDAVIEFGRPEGGDEIVGARRGRRGLGVEGAVNLIDP